MSFTSSWTLPMEKSTSNPSFPEKLPPWTPQLPYLLSSAPQNSDPHSRTPRIFKLSHRLPQTSAVARCLQHNSLPRPPDQRSSLKQRPIFRLFTLEVVIKLNISSSRQQKDGDLVPSRGQILSSDAFEKKQFFWTWNLCFPRWREISSPRLANLSQ